MTKSKISLSALNGMQKKYETSTITMRTWLSVSVIFFVIMVLKGSYFSPQSLLPSPELLFVLSGLVISAFLYDRNKRILNQIEELIEEDEQKLLKDKFINRLSGMKTKGGTVKLIFQKYGVLGCIDQKTNLTPFQRARLVLCTQHLIRENYF
ncbi:hypothetical protein B9J93_16760 [Vibrio sp. V17_P4S1T151]|uniref:hypothetical protein n=1 Tax=unclassified Vibrio TaxID=2614977 RepID=UPI000B8E6A3F|nr:MULTISPECIES: hypothetical protein [unclassified Vibrio]OXX42914.1 hypothetical protein B9J93_16760 [Vibrio sp. V17_P4S1T151]OXX64781.1 hypothetical protein B9J89_02610 [Vibrio sp. V15_P4S5T153]